MAIITLTTDFCTRDWFVGVMKGVILGINPAAKLVDLTHEIPAGDIRSGAFALRASAGYFPPGTIHLAVVDPGVGSERKAIAIKTERYCFVGPDNGLLSWAAANEQILAVHAIENSACFVRPVSRTFHGRDVFAPAAGHLSRGLDIKKLGPELKRFNSLSWPTPRASRNKIDGQIVYIDRFGNALTNIDRNAIGMMARAGARLFVGDQRISLAEYYQAVPVGQPVAIVGSCDLVEIAINGGDAVQSLKLSVGTKISVRRGQSL